jgi:hypothetical protein
MLWMLYILENNNLLKFEMCLYGLCIFKWLIIESSFIILNKNVSKNVISSFSQHFWNIIITRSSPQEKIQKRKISPCSQLMGTLGGWYKQTAVILCDSSCDVVGCESQGKTGEGHLIVEQERWGFSEHLTPDPSLERRGLRGKGIKRK